MITSFRHEGRELLFETGSKKGIDAQLAGKLQRLLSALHTAGSVENMNVPSYRLHQLKGDRKGQWSAWVSGNWRMVFAFDGGDAFDVDLVDYY